MFDAWTMIVYQVAAIQLLVIAILAYRYDRIATLGAGRYIGSLTLAIAALVIRIDVYWIARVLFGYDLTGLWWWRYVALFQIVAIIAVAATLIWHMVARVIVYHERARM